MSLVIIFIIVLIFLAFYILADSGLSEKLKVRAKGSVDEAFQQDAATPEGAKAYYNSMISKSNDEYQKANSVHIRMLGKINSYDEQIRQLQKESMGLDLQINACLGKEDDDGVRRCLRQQQAITEKIDILNSSLEELRKSEKLQSKVVCDAFAEMQDLKAEKEKAILTLETAESTKALKVTPGLAVSQEDKMLEAVREGVQRVKEEAEGSRIAYESSEFVQQQNLDKELKDAEIERKLQELKEKRNQ